MEGVGSWRKGRKREKSEIKVEKKVREGSKGEKSEIKVENKVGEGRREKREKSEIKSGEGGGENWKMGKRTKELCRVGEHQHRLAHQCSPCEKIVQDLKYM